MSIDVQNWKAMNAKIQLATQQMNQARAQLNALAPKAQKIRGKNYDLYRQAVCVIFDAYGYDPKNVSEWSVNELGFNTYALDENGNRIFEYHAYRKIWHDWPSEEMKTEVMTILNIHQECDTI